MSDHTTTLITRPTRCRHPFSTDCKHCAADLRWEQRQLDAAIRRADKRLKYWAKREKEQAA